MLSSTQRACLAQHGFDGNRPPQNLGNPAVGARLAGTLRDCGVIGGQPTGPTTTTTTAPPIIIS